VAVVRAHHVQRDRDRARWRAVGIGAGQQSRVVSAGIATTKAGEFAMGAAAASAPSSLRRRTRVTDERRRHLGRPTGGSVRDQEVIDAANDAKIVMMLTGERHFRH